MSVKTSADVLIGGKIYTLSGYESEEYLQKVANYINNKINEFDEMEQFRQIPADMLFAHYLSRKRIDIQMLQL